MNDFETVRRYGMYVETESSDEDAAEFYAALGRIEAEVERLQREKQGWVNQAAVEEKERLDAEAEVKRLRAAFSRYGDHDRACAAREKSLYACTCGFVDLVNELFPGRAALAKEEA